MTDPSRRDVLATLAALAPLAAAAQPGGSAAAVAGTEAALTATMGGLARGGLVRLAPGPLRLARTARLERSRLEILGEGPNVSEVRFDPVAPAAAIRIGNAEVGGVYQNAVRALGFSSGNAVNKTAIELHNSSETIIERIGIATGNWPGPGSIGVRTYGRETLGLRDSRIACARPVVFSPNPLHPMLSVDHLRLADCHLIATAPDSACIEFEDGVTMSTTTIERTALAGGRDGVRWRDRSSAGWSFGLALRDLRTEQGTDPQGWSIDLATARALQSLTIENCRLDNRRNGIRLRGVHRVTMINVDLDTRAANPRTLLDVEGVPGTALTMIGCFGQERGRIALRRLKRVQSVPPWNSDQPIGPFELWVYDPAA